MIEQIIGCILLFAMCLGIIICVSYLIQWYVER